MSIDKKPKNGNAWNTFMIIVVLTLVAAASFALGRLSLPQEELSVVRMNTLSALETNPGTTGFLVASRSGSKYHFPWCRGAQSIKDENKIYFTTYEEARGAGYTPAANCPGLE